MRNVFATLGCNATQECEQYIVPLQQAVHTYGISTNVNRLTVFISTIMYETQLMNSFQQQPNVAGAIPLSESELTIACVRIPLYRQALLSDRASCLFSDISKTCSCIKNQNSTALLAVASQESYAFLIAAWFISEGAWIMRETLFGCDDLRPTSDEGKGYVDCAVADYQYGAAIADCTSGLYKVTYCVLGRLGSDSAMVERLMYYDSVYDAFSTSCGSRTPSVTPSITPSISVSKSPKPPHGHSSEISSSDAGMIGGAVAFFVLATILLASWCRKCAKTPKLIYKDGKNKPMQRKFFQRPRAPVAVIAETESGEVELRKPASTAGSFIPASRMSSASAAAMTRPPVPTTMASQDPQPQSFITPSYDSSRAPSLFSSTSFVPASTVSGQLLSSRLVATQPMVFVQVASTPMAHSTPSFAPASVVPVQSVFINNSSISARQPVS
jgi:hypothetical protein